MSTTERYYELTPAERKQRATLTPAEQIAVDAFLRAAKALPKTLCIHVRDYDDGGDNLAVSKRITAGSAMRVAGLRKKSLVF